MGLTSCKNQYIKEIVNWILDFWEHQQSLRQGKHVDSLFTGPKCSHIILLLSGTGENVCECMSIMYINMVCWEERERERESEREREQGDCKLFKECGNDQTEELKLGPLDHWYTTHPNSIFQIAEYYVYDTIHWFKFSKSSKSTLYLYNRQSAWMEANVVKFTTLQAGNQSV